MRVLTTVLKQTEGMVSLDGILYNEGNYEKYRKRLVIFHRNSKDRTVLFSTHVVEDLATTCTQLAIMKKGSFYILEA